MKIDDFFMFIHAIKYSDVKSERTHTYDKNRYVFDGTETRLIKDLDLLESLDDNPVI